MRETLPGARGIPEPHAAFLARALEQLRKDSRLVGIAAGGSYAAGSMDEFSDLDLVIAVEPGEFQAVSRERREIAAGLGPLLAGFPGEHVGEPRLLICLYGPPPLHVDLKFVSLPDVSARVEDPAVLWDRDGRLGAALRAGEARYPRPDLQWIEDRFWTWIHYGAAKIGRGELFEAMDFLGFLRRQVLGPLSLEVHGARPEGVRRIEKSAPDLSRKMEATIAVHSAESCAAALGAAVRMYRDLRSALGTGTLRLNPGAEAAAAAYLADIDARSGIPTD